MTSRARVIESPASLDLRRDQLGELPPHRLVLMSDPSHFDVEYVINPHMAGKLGSVDRERARHQWEALVHVYRRLGYEVGVVPGQPGLPDMVFSANQSFPVGLHTVVMSRMASPQRRPEVAHYEAWYAQHGYKTLRLSDASLNFEGMGDAIWAPRTRVIVGGYGFRTERAALEDLARVVDAPVLALRLVDDRFYHLDTCFQALDRDTVLVVEEAFAPEAVDLLRAFFPRVVPLPLEEAANALSCNGYCPDERHYIVQTGTPETCRRVRDAGFEVIEVDTSEFLKSGGSVYCLKAHLY